jgi:hypothetical protein
MEEQANFLNVRGEDESGVVGPYLYLQCFLYLPDCFS